MIWLAKRLVTAVFLVWAVATLVFLAIHLVPGDPAELLLAQQGGSPDPAAVAALRSQLGLDRPVLTQYLDSMRRLAAGDVGVSLRDGTPVAAQIALRLPRTLELIGAAALVAIAFGIPLGTLAAVRHGRPTDRIVSALAGLSLSVPVFVLGTLAIMVFAQWLRWVPAGGFVAFSQDPGRHLLLLAMPASCIA